MDVAHMVGERDEAAAKAAFVAYFGDDDDWGFPSEQDEWKQIAKACVSAWLEAGPPVYRTANWDDVGKEGFVRGADVVEMKP